MIELLKDYAPRGKESSPYAQFFVDTKTGKRQMVVTQLPQIQPTGRKLACQWNVKGNKFSIADNLFDISVSQNGIDIVCPQDQPDGRKAGDKVSFNPQVYVGGSLVNPISKLPTILDIDPTNPNLLGNTIEWDYGFCKRIIRIIRGKVIGLWLFENLPSKDVRIKYNQTGDYRLLLGRFAVNNDEELIRVADYKNIATIYGLPIIISDSATYYPDTGTGSVTVDGVVWQENYNGGTWASIRDGVGNASGDTDNFQRACGIYSHSTTDKWIYLYRGILTFDTSGLPDDCTIDSGEFGIRGYDKAIDGAGWAPDLNIYSAAPAANNDLVSGDYDSLGTTPYCDTPITYAGYSIVGYNTFTLNATGLAAVSLTGITKIGTRNASYDVADSAPSWSASNAAYLRCYFADNGSLEPYLTVNYTPAVTFIPRIIGII